MVAVSIEILRPGGLRPGISFPKKKKSRTMNFAYRLAWATKLLLAVISLIFPALVLGYNIFIVKSMT